MLPAHGTPPSTDTMSTVSNNSPGPLSPKRRSRGWVWFFAVLIALTVTAVVVEIWYNVNQQLTPRQVEAARTLWREHGPSDYEIEYIIKRQERKDDQTAPRRPGAGEEKITVAVEGGKVVSTIREGGTARKTGEQPFGTMETFFDYVEQQLGADAEPGGPRVFVTAVCDRQNGRILRYIRSVRSTRERLEVITRLGPLPVGKRRSPPPSPGS